MSTQRNQWLNRVLAATTAIVAFASICPISNSVAADRVRVLLAIDGRSGLPGLDTNQEAMTEVFRKVIDAVGNGTIDLLPMDEVSPTSIQEALAAWEEQIDPSDVSVFYYSGHGGTDSNHGHFLATSGGLLRRSDLRRAMARGGPRLAVMLTDCCSTRATFRPPSLQKGIAAEIEEQLLTDLFVRHAGLVDITAATYYPSAQDGERGWYRADIGGVFTRSLVAMLGPNSRSEDANADGFTSWYELADHLQSETRFTYTQLRSEALESRFYYDPITFEKLKRQEHQTPQVFSLPRPLAGDDRDENYAGNLGIFFRMVRIEGGWGAVLTRLPSLGSPARQDRFEKGDTVLGLDEDEGYVLRTPVDLELHRLETEIRYINVRNGSQGQTILDLGPWVVPDYRASNLGVCYVLVPYSNSMAVHITRRIDRHAPLGQIHLEPGDLIVEFDGMPIRSHNDVLKQKGRTSVKVVNVRNGEISVDDVTLGRTMGRMLVPPDF